LDLGLPQVDGHEVLRQLRASPERADVPVIVLSTSSNPEDHRVAKEAGADAYLTKAPDFDGLEALVRHLLEWEFPRLGILAA
jgi:DNA-binding response OmpR family regulator